MMGILSNKGDSNLCNSVINCIVIAFRTIEEDNKGWKWLVFEKDGSQGGSPIQTFR